jgi:hypothetical protein
LLGVGLVGWVRRRRGKDGGPPPVALA